MKWIYSLILAFRRGRAEKSLVSERRWRVLRGDETHEDLRVLEEVVLLK